MIECDICSCVFNATKENHYIARDSVETGLALALTSKEEGSIYDAFDCPMCGCQMIVKERKHKEDIRYE